MKIKKIIKIIYHLIPFKRPIFLGLKFFWKPPESIYKYLTFKGILTVQTRLGTYFKIKHFGDIIENEIFWSSMKNWEKVSTGIWSELCKDASVVFDVGANTGIYSLISKSINPNAFVYAFEPVARVYQKLIINNNINNFNISCNEIALSNYDGEATLYDVGDDHVYTAYVNKNHFSKDLKTTEIKIKATSLNSFIRTNNIEKLDLMKIDVELHEVEVLEGFSDYLSVFKPTILIEILNNEIGQKVEKLVTGLNYEFFNIDENTGIRKVDKIEKSDYYNYLLCTKEIAKKYNLINMKW